MSDTIFETDETFPFQKMTLTTPIMMTGGIYFIKYLVNKQTVYIQPPKCKTRQGIIKAGKKYYCDLLFTNENDEFIRWVEELETNSQQMIYENRNKWFDGNLEKHDIESCFTSSLKVFKSGKFYSLRVNIPTRLGNCALKLFDESERDIDIIEITDQSTILTILEVQGIRCSSRNFQIDFEIKQMMLLRPEKFFEKCIISPKQKQTSEVMNMQISEQREGTSLDAATQEVGRSDTWRHLSKGMESHEVPEETIGRVQCSLMENSSDGVLSLGKMPEEEVHETREDAEGVISEDVIPDENEDEKRPCSSEQGLHQNNIQYEPEQLEEEDVSNSPIDSMVQNLGNVRFNSETPLLREKTKVSDEGMEMQCSDAILPKEQTTVCTPPALEDLEKMRVQGKHELDLLEPGINDFAIEEVELPISIDETIQLKSRRNEYYELYQKAKQKAIYDQNVAFASYLEAKKIKEQYNFEDSDTEEPMSLQ